jgi:GNAT superfamily N-acetyltransferase
MEWASPNLAAQVAWLEHLGTAPGAEVIERDGIYAVRTRVRSNAENGIVSGPPSRVTLALAQQLAGWFGEWGVPASWLCAEEAGRAEARSVLESAGYRPERSAWEMRARIAELDLAAPHGEGISIARVTSEAGLERWLDIAAVCGWCESEGARAALKELYTGLGLASGAPLRHYVASLEGTVAGMASAFFTGDAIVLAAAAVVPASRRRGVGRALALARLREARDEGCALALLSPSPDGSELYETLGFDSVPAPMDRWFYAPMAVS